MMGKAPAFNANNRNTDTARKVNLNLLFAQEKFLNFSEKSSMGDTINNEKITVIPVRTGVVNTIDRTESGKKTSEVMNMAFAGVGTPINKSVCRASTLNLANRNAEKTAIISDT